MAKPTVNESPENKSPNLVVPGHTCVAIDTIFSLADATRSLRLKSFWSWKKCRKPSTAAND